MKIAQTKGSILNVPTEFTTYSDVRCGKSFKPIVREYLENLEAKQERQKNLLQVDGNSPTPTPSRRSSTAYLHVSQINEILDEHNKNQMCRLSIGERKICLFAYIS